MDRSHRQLYREVCLPFLREEHPPFVWYVSRIIVMGVIAVCLACEPLEPWGDIEALFIRLGYESEPKKGQDP